MLFFAMIIVCFLGLWVYDKQLIDEELQWPQLEGIFCFFLRVNLTQDWKKKEELW